LREYICSTAKAKVEIKTRRNVKLKLEQIKLSHAAQLGTKEQGTAKAFARWIQSFFLKQFSFFVLFS